jgi:hypothetical protein
VVDRPPIGADRAGSERIPAWELSGARTYLRLVNATSPTVGPLHQTRENTMSITYRPRTTTRIAAVAAGVAAAAVAVAGASSASAESYASYLLAPGQGACTSTQYAGYQVRADGWATGQGAKFKLLRNGSVWLSSPTRGTAWAAQLSAANGTFPGPGSYTVCAQNTGTTNTTVTLRLRTDGEL